MNSMEFTKNNNTYKIYNNERSFVGIEIEQKYYDISLKRIKNNIEQYKISDYM